MEVGFRPGHIVTRAHEFHTKCSPRPVLSSAIETFLLQGLWASVVGPDSGKSIRRVSVYHGGGTGLGCGALSEWLGLMCFTPNVVQVQCYPVLWRLFCCKVSDVVLRGPIYVEVGFRPGHLVTRHATLSKWLGLMSFTPNVVRGQCYPVL